MEHIVNDLIPVLQQAGRFQTDYDGTTLRDHLGLEPFSACGPRMV